MMAVGTFFKIMDELKQDKSILVVEDNEGLVSEYGDYLLSKSTDMEKILELACAKGTAFYKYEQGKKYWEMEEL